MRIEELIVDGFKSYAVRTHITGWDASFNAITGLNGSGKSNILDAICFVLGITNMSQVRASNLQDLIYKRGQAGVTKASVTVVFSNEDRQQSPVGFEQYRQITVTRQILLGGQSKYFINGHKAQQQAVQNLFQSVQLNINNPNFLIMQGKITKVLNMKPEEILSMIEEAAGTRMFEERKDKAIKTIAKKDKKVDDITSLLKEEIEPKLEHLRNEKRSYLEFQKTQAELERVRRHVVQYEHYNYKATHIRLKSSIAEKSERLMSVKKNIDELEDEVVELQDRYSKVTSQSTDFTKKQAELRRLEELAKVASNEMARVDAVFDISKSKVADAEQKINAAKQDKFEAQKSLQHKQVQLRQDSELAEKSQWTLDRKQSELREQEHFLQTVTGSGASAKSAEESFRDQLANATQRFEMAQKSREQAQLKLKNTLRERGECKAKAHTAQQSQEALSSALQTTSDTIAELEKTLLHLDSSAAVDPNLSVRQKALQRDLQGVLQERDSIQRQISKVIFNYSDPSGKINSDKVKGPVARLLRLKDENSAQALAVEISAGGRLYNVVVEDEKVGTDLLKYGGLTKRVTIIPLSKIDKVVIPADRIAKADSLAPGKVVPAVGCVTYEPQVENAIRYAFGDTFICQDAASAKAVTFHKDIRAKSVTWDGDVYDPSGTLQGGSQPSAGGLLKKIQKLDSIDLKVRGIEQELSEVQERLRQSNEASSKVTELKAQVDLKKHEAQLIDSDLKTGSAAKVLGELNDLEASLAFQTTALENVDREVRDTEDALKAIESNKESFTKDKGSTIQTLKSDISTRKKEVEQLGKELRDLRKLVQGHGLDIEQLETDIVTFTQQVTENETQLHVLRTESTQLDSQSRKCRGDYQELKAQVEVLYQDLHACDLQSRELDNQLKNTASNLTEQKILQQSLEHDLQGLTKETSACLQGLEALLSEHSWLKDEKGVESFKRDSKTLSEARNALIALEEKFAPMKNRVNGKVMTMLESVEKKEAALQQMLSTVQKDKHKIEQTIMSLDDYKKEALLKTWETVDKDFGAIFGELLPGNDAKLVIPEGKDITQGLEVRVRLGQVWKESLTELSGGQRSLIALSLILSLLQFKPAPMYILDEVDAALDLSHTQNIGHLLRTRFRGAQFIIVSLKDGMFNNANVLFRTRFRDGTSVVERTSQADAIAAPGAKMKPMQRAPLAKKQPSGKLNVYN